jgi:hypothetical protein
MVMSESLFPTRRFEHATVVGNGFRLVAGTLHNLRPTDAVRNRTCAWRALHDAQTTEQRR